VCLFVSSPEIILYAVGRCGGINNLTGRCGLGGCYVYSQDHSNSSVGGAVSWRSGQDRAESLFFLLYNGKFEKCLLHSGAFQLASGHFPQVEGVVTTAKPTASVGHMYKNKVETLKTFVFLLCCYGDGFALTHSRS